MERENLSQAAKGKRRGGDTPSANTDAGLRGGCTRSSEEAAVMAVERRGAQEQPTGGINLSDKDELLPKAKPFVISKQMVMQAYRKVKSNDGVAGVDGESLNEFEIDLKRNLYKLWNRLSSGSYFPPPVKAVQIKKAG